MTPVLGSGLVAFGSTTPNPFVGATEASASGGVEGVETSAPNPDKAALVVAASNPLVDATEASAFGGAEVAYTSAPNLGNAALVVAASNPLVGATAASAFGGVEGVPL